MKHSCRKRGSWRRKCKSSRSAYRRSRYLNQRRERGKNLTFQSQHIFLLALPYMLEFLMREAGTSIKNSGLRDITPAELVHPIYRRLRRNYRRVPRAKGLEAYLRTCVGNAIRDQGTIEQNDADYVNTVPLNNHVYRMAASTPAPGESGQYELRSRFCEAIIDGTFRRFRSVIRSYVRDQKGPELTKDAFVKTKFEGWSLREVAAISELEKTAIAVRVSRLDKWLVDTYPNLYKRVKTIHHVTGLVPDI